MSLPPLAILAGGLATRMLPVTEALPKSLIPVRGEPFLAHQLRLAHRQGFREAVLCVGHFGEQIERYLTDHGSFGVDVAYSYDGEARRGTGGALRQALSKLPETFFVLYGDSYLDIEAAPVYDAFLERGASALMTVLHNRDRFDRSNVVFDGRLVREHCKIREPRAGVDWIDYGLSVMTAEVVAEWPDEDPFDLSALTAALAVRGKLAGFEVDRRFYEIGKPEGLNDLEAYLAPPR